MTMRHKGAATVAAVMGFALVGFSTQALAQNDGALDGVWMNAELKGKVNLVDFSSPPPFPVERNVKVRTAKDACYVALDWNGPDSYSYLACSICRDASGDWDWVDDDTFWEVSGEDNALVDDWSELEFLAEGDEYGDGSEFDTEGFLLLQFKLKDGTAKSVKEVTTNQMVYREDDPADTDGTGKGKLKLDIADPAEVPAEAVTAFENCLED